MTSADDLQLQKDDETPRRLPAWFHSQAAFGWTACATLSLLSDRHLLVESNFHHPVLVYISQLCMTTIVVILHRLWHHQKGSGGHRTLRVEHGKLITFAAMGFTALSMLCVLQAVLHFSSLPTLAMLLTIAIFAHDSLFCLCDHTYRKRTELLRLSVMLLACVGILATEYRLTVPALISSILAMLFAGVATGLSGIAARHQRQDELPSRAQKLLYLVVTGYLIAAGWMFLFWPHAKAIALDSRHVLLLLFNAATTTAALLMGQSTLLPMVDLSTSVEPDTDRIHSEPQNTWIILGLAGAVGSYSTLSVRRPYTSWYQLCSFAVAILCVAYGDDRRTRHTPSMQYELLDRFEVDEETAIHMKAVQVVERPAFPETRKGIAKSWSKPLIVAMLLIWTAYMCLNFAAKQHTSHSALDRVYEPLVPLEVVISMYKEPTEDVRHLIAALNTESTTSGASVTIYNKNPNADVEIIRSETGAHRVFQLPNVGREGETYLYHINHQWDNLAQHTIFLQADIHNPREFYTRLWSYFDPVRTGFLSLGWSDVCSCEECGDRNSWRDTTGLFPLYHQRINNSTECKDILLSYKGQFVVSAARIRGISKTIYNDLWHGFVDQDSWAHQPEYLQGRPDSMSAPDFGYTMERMWNVLFQCSDVEVAWKCPTLLSGWRSGGDIGDCQCFDSALVY